MILYHISTNLKHSGIFVPKIPESILNGENEDNQRVCVGDSIESCLISMPEGGFELEKTIFEKNDTLKVFKIDTDKLGIPIRDIITPDELVSERLVFDAQITNEHWILNTFKVPEEDIFYIKISSWQEEVRSYENIDFYEKMDILEMSYEDLINSDYYDGDLISSACYIYNLQYDIISDISAA